MEREIRVMLEINSGSTCNLKFLTDLRWAKSVRMSTKRQTKKYLNGQIGG